MYGPTPPIDSTVSIGSLRARTAWVEQQTAFYPVALAVPMSAPVHTGRCGCTECTPPAVRWAPAHTTSGAPYPVRPVPVSECEPLADLQALLSSLAATARRELPASAPWRPAVVRALLALFGHGDYVPPARWLCRDDAPAMPVFRADGTIGDGVYRLERAERPVRVPAQPVRYFASAPTVWVKGERPSVERARTALADVVTLAEPRWLTAITACTERRYCGRCETPLKRERGRWLWRCECTGVDTARPATVTGWDITGGLVPRRALRTLADTGAPADVATVLHRECRDCGAAFTIPRRRGRPAVKCEQCR